MARLKVFASAQGFFETVVAAASQKAALEAWGTHQNLFADGMAKVADDPAAVEAALANPGQVLQRAAGTQDPFRPAGQAPPPAAPKINRPKSKAKAAPPKPPPPDRSALTAAETALAAADARIAADQAEIDQARAELDRREFELEQAARRDLKDLKAAVDKARRAFEKAGGRP